MKSLQRALVLSAILIDILIESGRNRCCCIMPHIINAQIELLQIYLSTEVAEPRRHFGALRIYYHESRFCEHVRAMNITQAGAFCYFEALFSPRLDIRQPRRVNPEVLDLDVITASRT